MRRKGSGGNQKVKMTPAESFFKIFQPMQPPTDGRIGLNEYEEMKEVRVVNCYMRFHYDLEINHNIAFVHHQMSAA